MRSDCACKCTNVLEKRACFEAGRIWDEATCSCPCSGQDCFCSKDCSPEQELDPASCSCSERVGSSTRSLLNLSSEERAP